MKQITLKKRTSKRLSTTHCLYQQPQKLYLQMCCDRRRAALGQEGYASETGSRQTLDERRDVFLQARRMGIDDIGYPPGEQQPITFDSFGTEQRMVDAPQADADHQNHRQLQVDGQVGQVARTRQRHPPTARAFDQ